MQRTWPGERWIFIEFYICIAFFLSLSLSNCYQIYVYCPRINMHIFRYINVLRGNKSWQRVEEYTGSLKMLLNRYEPWKKWRENLAYRTLREFATSRGSSRKIERRDPKNSSLIPWKGIDRDVSREFGKLSRILDANFEKFAGLFDEYIATSWIEPQKFQGFHCCCRLIFYVRNFLVLPYYY